MIARSIRNLAASYCRKKLAKILKCQQSEAKSNKMIDLKLKITKTFTTS